MGQDVERLQNLINQLDKLIEEEKKEELANPLNKPVQ